MRLNHRTGLLNRLDRLPRDSRDTLFLLGVIGWVLLLQAPYLPVWCTALTTAVLLWRGALAWQQRPLPAWPWKLAVLALAVLGTLWTHRSLLGQDAGVTLIVALLALKTLELRARRDAFVVFYLGFFTLLTHFLHSQSLLTALGIVLALLGLLTALVNAQRPLGRPPLWHSARLAGGMALLGAPIMVALFLLFPRFAPLWGMPNAAALGRTGLSDDMVVGQVAQLAQDDSIAFRVDFLGAQPPQGALYFRGPVLTAFDGRQWRPLPPPAPPRNARGTDHKTADNLSVQGTGLPYRLTLEPHQRPWLLALDATPELPPSTGLTAQRDAEGVWRSQRPVLDVLRYTAAAYLQYHLGPLEPHANLAPALALPKGYNSRTLAWAAELRGQHGANPHVLLQAALQQLGNGGYRYTLEPGLYSRDTADDFWFDRKAGFCEHIASSFAVLMRAAGVPARVVTGYQGGVYNAVGGFWTVRQSDAHAWTEVWLAQRGWVRVDPTAYVQPSRTEGLTRLSPPPGLLMGTLVNLNPTLLAHLRNLWDATNNRWNQWVLNYTQNRQLDLIRQLGLRAASSLDLLVLLFGSLSGLTLLGATLAWWLGRQRAPWQRLLLQARQRLVRAGLPLPHQATPRQMQAALRASAWHPSTAALQQWLLDLESARYDPASTHTSRTLANRLNHLPWPHPARASRSPTTATSGTTSRPPFLP